MDKTASKPMPCPFCGGANIKLYSAGPEWTAQCETCMAQGPWVEPKDSEWADYERPEREACDAWNRRSPSEPQAHPAPVSKEPGEAAGTPDAFMYTVRRSRNGRTETSTFAAIDYQDWADAEWEEKEVLSKRPLYLSAPLPEARGAEETVDAEAAARDITHYAVEHAVEWAALSSDAGAGHEIRIAAIIRRHTHAPGEGWVMQQKFDAVERQYNELIYAVARKYKDESRHATALRYIREREEQAAQSGSDKAAAPQAEGK